MHSSLVVDTSVWASRLMAHDANHLASQAWAAKYVMAGGMIVIPEFMLIELAATLARQMQQPIAAKQIARDLYTDVLSIKSLDTKLVQLAIDLAVDLRLKGGDAIYVALAHQMGIPLVSWDREQLSRASTLIETYTPTNYPF